MSNKRNLLSTHTTGYTGHFADYCWYLLCRPTPCVLDDFWIRAHVHVQPCIVIFVSSVSPFVQVKLQSRIKLQKTSIETRCPVTKWLQRVHWTAPIPLKRSILKPNLWNWTATPVWSFDERNWRQDGNCFESMGKGKVHCWAMGWKWSWEVSAVVCECVELWSWNCGIVGLWICAFGILWNRAFGIAEMRAFVEESLVSTCISYEACCEGCICDVRI